MYQQKDPQNNKARVTEDACGSTQWLRCTCNTDPSNHYQCSCSVYGMDSYGCLYYPNPSTGSNNNLVSFTNGGGSNFSISSGGGINNYAVNANNVSFAYDSNEPSVPDIRYKLKCFAAGTNTTNYTYAITVYVDEPYPNSGSSISYSGNVGHVWIGFQKTNNQTGAVSASSIGLYPSSYGPSAMRSGVPSNVKENSSHAADVSITYAVNSDQFDRAVNSAVFNSNRSYSLENYNCTDYINTICSDAGLVIPKPVSYFAITNPTPPYMVEVFAVHSPGALGVALRQINSNAVKTNQNPPQQNDNCN